MSRKNRKKHSGASGQSPRSTESHQERGLRKNGSLSFTGWLFNTGLRSYAGYGFYILAIVGSGFLFSLSLFPYSQAWAGLLSLVLLVGLARYCFRGSFWFMLFTAWLVSLSFQLFSFFWIPGTIQTYAGTSREAATVYALLYSVIYQLRVFLLFGGLWYSFRRPRYGVFIAGFSALMGDLFAPQVFNWYWGNMTEGWLHWRLLASLGGVYLAGVLFVILARLLYDVALESLRFFLSLRSRQASRRGDKGGTAARGALDPFLKECLGVLEFPYTSHQAGADGLKEKGSQEQIEKAQEQASSQEESDDGKGSVPMWRHWLRSSSCSLYFLLLILSVLIHGWWHLHRIEESLSRQGPDQRLKVAMLQTATSKKNMGSLTDYEHAAGSMNRVVNQSLETIYRSGAGIDLIILPESAIPYHGITPGEKQVYSVTMHALISYLFGISRSSLVFNQLQQGRDKPDLTYNTASLLDPGSSSIQNYRKRVLIPFGEYLPLEKQFPSLRKIFPGSGRYSPEQENQALTMEMNHFLDRPRLNLLNPADAGVADPEQVWTSPGDALRAGLQVYRQSYGATTSLRASDGATDASGNPAGPAAPVVPGGPKSWHLSGSQDLRSGAPGQNGSGKPEWLEGRKRKLEFAVLICYEDLIPDMATSAFQDGQPDFLVNISNDSWLSHPRAMYQHYGAARFRAVETGRFLLRSTLTGVSGIMDPAGRDFTEASSINVQGTMLEVVPVSGNVNTLYAKMGTVMHYIMLLLLILLPFLHFLFIGQKKKGN